MMLNEEKHNRNKGLLTVQITGPADRMNVGALINSQKTSMHRKQTEESKTSYISHSLHLHGRYKAKKELLMLAAEQKE